MKIAIIAPYNHPIIPENLCGVNVLIYALIEGLHKSGGAVTLFAEHGSKVDCDLRTFNSGSIDWGYDEEPGEQVKRLAEEQYAYLEVFKILQESDYDMVHNLSLNHQAVFTAQFLPVPTLTTLYSSPLPLLQSTIKLSQGEKNYYVTVNHELSNIWSPHTFIDDIIYQGIDEVKYKFNELAKDSQAIWFGNINPDCKLEDAIAVCRLKGFKLWIAGEVQDEVYFKDKIEPGMGNNVEFLGDDLLDKELIRYLNRAEVSIVTGADQKYSGANVLKSLSCGTPVAAYHHKGLMEYLPSTCGAFAAENDLGSLGKALIGASLKKRTECRKFVENSFTRKRMIDEYLHLYKKIINKHTENTVAAE